jgi:NADH-quinone oxidoreductase subunit H
MWPIAAIFFVTIIAETNRAPFDLPEAEAEIVAGYNLEYSSIIFAMFFLGEYSNIFLMSTLFAVMFMGGWLPVLGLTFIPAALWLQLKAVFMCFMFVLVRATFPRYRYDQLMSLCWQVFLPFNFIYLLILALIFGLA